MPHPPLPRYAPMLATEGKLPPDDEDGRYAYEVKYDGWAALAYVERSELRLASRNGADLTREDVAEGLEHFPTLLARLFKGENTGKLVLKV